MCGITGFVGLRGAGVPPLERLRAMCDTLVHRGPDAEGMLLRNGVGLGARRLAIIDPAGGHQPLSNEDGSVVVVFNGEIYNYRELQSQLRSRGHTLGSESDGEVLPHLWEDCGGGFLDPVNGMFGLALHDPRHGRVILARDRLGIKPLYYAVTPDHVVFGSEIKAILASGLVNRDLDLDALRQFLAWEYVPAPHTLFRGIRKLRPGELIEIHPGTGQLNSRIYWDVPTPEENRAEADARPGSNDWESEVETLLGRAVGRQLVSDVPLGAFLSGGVDSSLVVACMGEASTYSIGFADPGYDELKWSGRVAEHLGVRHVTEVISPDVAGLFDHLMHFMDDPIGDFSVFPTYLVSRLAKKEVTVALSGDGGDELFGGYDSFRAELLSDRYKRIPSVLRSKVLEPLVGRFRPRQAKKGVVNKARRFIEGLNQDPALGHARWRIFLGSALSKVLFTPEAIAEMEVPVGSHILDLSGQSASRNRVDRMLYVDLKSYLPDNCLVKVDRMSMGCSLEARVPFLDHHLVELAFRIPAPLKIRRSRTKVLLKSLAAKRVPKDCAYRQKEGFSIPIKNWLRTSLRPLMMDLLDEDRIGAEGVFQARTVRTLMSEHLEERENHSHLLWSLMVFQDWQRRWAP
jgi:asparagine synthase (glutamine-hydrolysing)